MLSLYERRKRALKIATSIDEALKDGEILDANMSFKRRRSMLLSFSRRWHDVISVCHHINSIKEGNDARILKHMYDIVKADSRKHDGDLLYEVLTYAVDARRIAVKMYNLKKSNHDTPNIRTNKIYADDCLCMYARGIFLETMLKMDRKKRLAPIIYESAFSSHNTYVDISSGTDTIMNMVGPNSNIINAMAKNAEFMAESIKIAKHKNINIDISKLNFKTSEESHTLNAIRKVIPLIKLDMDLRLELIKNMEALHS